MSMEDGEVTPHPIPTPRSFQTFECKQTEGRGQDIWHFTSSFQNLIKIIAMGLKMVEINHKENGQRSERAQQISGKWEVNEEIVLIKKDEEATV